MVSSADVIAEAGVLIRPLVDGVEDELIEKLEGPAGAAGEKAGEEAGKGFNKELVNGLSKASAVVAGAAGLIAKSWNAGVNTIRTETGLTGEALDKLVESARNVSKSGITTGFEEVGQTIAALRQRTKLTGPALEALTRQVIQLSELTGGDASDSVEKYIDLFKLWQVETADQAGLLDLLFVTSQKTGQSIDSLVSSLTAGVGPLTNFGFSLEQALGFIGQIEAEGGNAPKIINALQIAFVKLSTTSKDPEHALERLSKRIKEAETTARATRIAVDAFGSRAGPILASAIRKGRFEVDDFVKSLRDSKETIASAREDTTTLGDRFTMLRENIAATVGPWSQAIAVGATIVTAIGPTIQLIQKYEQLGIVMKTVSLGAGILTAALIGAKAASDEGLGLEDARRQVDDLAKSVKAGTLSYEDFIYQTQQIAKSTVESADFARVIRRSAADLHRLGISGPEDLTKVKDELGRTQHQVTEAGHTIKKFAGMTRAELHEWRDSAEDNLQDISGAFGRLADDSKITADELIHAFRRQIEATRDFKKNLNTLIRRGAKPEFIQDLIDMGDQGARWAQGLAEDNRKTTREFFKAKEGAGQALGNLTKLVAKAERDTKQHSRGIREGLEGIGHGADSSRGKVDALTASIANLLAEAAQVKELDFPTTVPGTPRQNKNRDPSKGGG